MEKILEVKNIEKYYGNKSNLTKAIYNINFDVNKGEFVGIMGASGSGKTTCLNVIGGLDKYDSGDLIINGKSTKKFKATEWDSYRNNCVGVIFQSYNLIINTF